MELGVLGPLEVRRAGEVVDVRGSKRRALLALLILHANEVIPSERLIDELWGGRPPASASAALHNLVWRLRKDLGSELLVTEPWGYLLRIDPETVDLHRFDLLVREAKSLPAHERRAKLAEALGLWRGPALTGLEHEPSLSVEIARLDDLRLVALEQRIDADLDLGAHEEVVPELEALVGEHPLRERPRGQLILALYRSGRQAEALEAYRETRRVLVDELGIEPSPELRELERAILRQDPALASSAPVEPAEVGAGRPPRSRGARSPLVIGAGLALLAAGGATAGLLLTEGAHSHPVAKRPGSATPHDSTVGDSSATGAAPLVTPAGMRAKHRAAKRHRSVTRHPKRKPGGHHRPRQTKTAQTPPPPSAPPPPAPPPPPPPTPPRPLRQWVYWLSDDFTNPAVNFDVWGLASSGNGVDTVEQNGRLELSVGPDVVTDANHSVSKHYATRCLLKGDFDAKVDFSLLTWPAADGVHLGFGAWFPPPQDNWLSIERNGGTADGPEYYGSSIAYRASALSDNTSGAFRIKRTKGVLSVYYRSGRIWKRLAWKWAPAPAALVLMLWTSDDLFGHQSATAALDNFDAISDGVVCGGAPLPPRKRRR